MNRRGRKLIKTRDKQRMKRWAKDFSRLWYVDDRRITEPAPNLIPTWRGR